MDGLSKKIDKMVMDINANINSREYNIAIGGFVLYGFIANALLVYFCNSMVKDMNAAIIILGYFLCSIIGVVLVYFGNEILSFIGYNLVVVPIGILLAICMPQYPADSIIQAALITGGITAAMLVVSSIKPELFRNMGISLLIALTLSIIGEVISYFTGYSGNGFSWLFIIIFTLYIGYDWSKAQKYPESIKSAIVAALNLYLDIINIFLRVLQITSRKRK